MILVVTCILAPVLCAAAPTPQTLWPVASGIEIGMSERSVYEVVGPPQAAEELPPEDALGMGAVKRLTYDGLEVHVHSTPGTAEFRVTAVTVTGRHWAINGSARIGDSPEAVRAALGQPESASESDGFVVWHWFLGKGADGWCFARFKDAHLVEFGFREDWS